MGSGVVYKTTCPRCDACYVGQTSRHLQQRIQEHSNNSGPVKKHFNNCQQKLDIEKNVDVIGATNRGEEILLTLEALWIDELKPPINIKDEYRRRSLTIKLQSEFLTTYHQSTNNQVLYQFFNINRSMFVKHSINCII